MCENGKTIVVLGSGFNHIYPEENISLVKEIIKNGGAIISEYPPNTEVNLSNFPIRNRIIAGLSKCTIVVEAKFRSGSSVTARHSILQGKRVYCIPGRIGDKTSKGTNNLIKKGAYILTNVNEILNELGEERIEENEHEIEEFKQQEGKKLKMKSEECKSFEFDVEPSSVRNTTKKNRNSPNKNIREQVKIQKEYRHIYKLLSKAPMNVDEIARTLNINIAEVNMKLTMMEIEGLVEMLPGNIIKIKES